jgi:uncharacterized tellurite resistance protein B-like protein
MLATINAMADARDRSALNDLWRLLGGGSSVPADADRDLALTLVHRLCGKGDPYAAERASLAQLAETVGLDAARFPHVEPLEDAIIEALAAKLQERLRKMSPEERNRFFEDMVKRMSDEDRLRLIEQVLEGYAEMDPREQAAFRKRLANELGVSESDITKAIAGGAGTLIPLLLAKQTGFAIFLWTTNVMAAAASSVGITIPFAVYMFKNRALGWLLGPVGMVVTTALSLGWFAAKTWRRKERFRKLIQVVAYCSAWRAEQDA